MNKLPERLKELRADKGLTQGKLADQLQIHRVTYQYWEKGKSQPDIDKLLLLADFYKVSTDYLIGRYN